MSANNIEQISSYPNKTIYQVTLYNDQTIQTTVTSCPNAVSDWIDRIESIHRYRLGHLVVGLDVEWRPHNRFHKNPVAVVQLCVGHHCIVFQILHAEEVPEELDDFLRNEDYTFVGVGVGDDCQKLWDDYGLWVCNTVDLRVLASIRYNERQLRNQGLIALASRVLNLNYQKRKDITVSNWSVPDLSLAQIRYAAIDAFLSFDMGRVLNAAHFQE